MATHSPPSGHPFMAQCIPGDEVGIYIMYGPSDEIEDHASGGPYQRTPEEGGGITDAFPFQQWRYRR